MNTPHVLKVRFHYLMGMQYTFHLTGMNVANLNPNQNLSVTLTETVQPVTWKVDQLIGPANNRVTVKATPGVTLGKDLDGGGDGSLTITVDNGVTTDPDPPVVPSSYS